MKMETNDFKQQNNYTEEINQKAEVINTCQDCTFSTYTKRLSANELHCLEGNIVVSINGVCNRFMSVL